jgi:hypothetical protein
MEQKTRGGNHTGIIVLRWCARIAGLLAFVLGLMLGRAGFALLIRVHMALGIVLVLALVLLSILGLSARVQSALPFVSLACAVVVFVVGITQNRLLPGGGHWVIEVIHPLLGIAAMGLSDAMAAAVSRHSTVA